MTFTDFIVISFFRQTSGNWSWWPSWRPTSMSLLKSAEAKILSCKILTSFAHLNMPPSLSTGAQTPLVMIHGFGGGVGLWIRNLDALSHSRPVYAVDLLGFGRSSRPLFPSDALLAEEQFVTSIEQWRQSLGLERMILLGHSLGGYLATSYTIQYPERYLKKSLVLAKSFVDDTSKSSYSRHHHVTCVHAGPGLVNRFRPDFKRKFEDLFEDDTMMQYIYHCNAQNPSGEVGFKAMSESIGWAKRPMVQRVHLLPPSIPTSVTVRNYCVCNAGHSLNSLVGNIKNDSSFSLQLIEDASHHVYADQPEEFNRVVESICNTVD
uniref:Abhydrolase domain containing 4 n=1 Tax=Sinocyclocheilus grahami TaxID=75366 RepID=A0A672KG82_SINGR